MICLPISSHRYQEILVAFSAPELRIKLAANPTTMGPRYISEMIAKVLAAKSVINEWAEEVERAYTKSQILENDLETELALRTDMEINQIDPQDIEGMDAASRKALVRQRVEEGYIQDLKMSSGPNTIPPGPFQLWEDLRAAQNCNIELKSLLKMLDRRRDELNKLDSGVRLQQKTIDTEVSIHKSHLPQSAAGKALESFNGSEPDAIGEDGQDATEDQEVPEATVANGTL
jgi:hypothetical protein